jgi:DNA-binding CsgD family transcriptional regulator
MTEMVGRDAEREEIERWLDASPSTLVVEGEAGIGKTTLWRAGVERARARDHRVLAASSSSSEAQLSFTALRDLLSGAFDDVGDELPPPQRHALGVMLLREEPGRAPSDPGAIGVAVLTTLRLLAARGPTVVAIDDLQWLDSASERPLAYALRRLDGHSVRVLLARRPGNATVLTTVVRRAGRTLPLEALTIGALGRMLHDRLGTSFPRPTLYRLHEASGGNPFFALELGRALATSRAPIRPGAPLPVPGTLQELVSERLGALPTGTVEALAVAASLSRPTAVVVGFVLGRDPSFDLDRATEEHVIELDDDVIRFEHPLLAAWAYDRSAPARRREIHQRLAAIVPDGEERARHLALSTSGPDAAVADALESAAAAARARVVAAELYDAAARSTPEERFEERTRRATAAAAALFDAGDADGARTGLEQAIAAAPPCEPRLDAQALLGRLLVETSRRDEAIAILQGALEATTDPAYTADVRSVLATVELFAGSTTSALEHAEAAIEAARASGDDGRLAYAFAARAMVAVSVGEPYESYLEQALELEPPPGTRGSAWDWSPTNAAASCALRALDVDVMRTRFGALHEDGVARGNQDLEQYGAYGLAVAELASGFVERAAELATVVAELADVTGVLHLPALRLRAEIDGHRGRPADARRALETVISESEKLGEARAAWHARVALGSLELADGDPAAAARELRGARELADRMRLREPGMLLVYVDEVEAASEAELPGQAQEALTALRAVRHPAGWAEPLALRGEAAIRAAAGELAEAAVLLESAVASRHHISPVQHGRTLLALGRVSRRARRIRDARSTLSRALELFEEAGAVAWAAQVRAELGRIGGRAPSTGELTPTETRVAELVAEGKANKEVAVELVVSVHTVEAALTSIYRKLDVRSRTEMARKLTEVGASKD